MTNKFWVKNGFFASIYQLWKVLAAVAGKDSSGYESENIEMASNDNAKFLNYTTTYHLIFLFFILQTLQIRTSLLKEIGFLSKKLLFTPCL